MRGERAGWYLVAYDIADPKRLQRVFRLMKKNGVAAQRSVFFVNGTESRINGLLNGLAAIMKPNEDDLRAYPVEHPKKVWSFGPNPLAGFPLSDFENMKPAAKQKKPKGKWRRLLGL